MINPFFTKKNMSLSLHAFRKEKKIKKIFLTFNFDDILK